MWALIVSFFKSLVEFLKLGKYIYNETKPTQTQVEEEIKQENIKEKEEAQSSGRPKWD
jgi:hypothetical protein